MADHKPHANTSPAAATDEPRRNLTSDPLYKHIEAIELRDKSKGRENLLIDRETKGDLQAYLDFLSKAYDSVGRQFLECVRDLADAERLSQNLSSHAQMMLDREALTFSRLERSRNVPRGSISDKFGSSLARLEEHWKAELFQKALDLEQEPASAKVTRKENSTKAIAKTRPLARIKCEMVRDWMTEEGYTVPELAQRLGVSERVITSILNQDRYHGNPAVTKLAKEMNRDIADLYEG
jgi:hypothetical protein